MRRSYPPQCNWDAGQRSNPDHTAFVPLHLDSCLALCEAFLLADFQLQLSALLSGDTHEKWIKDTLLDIRTSS
jgi:hypothetical protein